MRLTTLLALTALLAPAAVLAATPAAPAGTGIAQLRQEIRSFYAARDRGDRKAASDAAMRARSLFQSLPQATRTEIEAGHPGTTTRIAQLADELNPNGAGAIAMDGSVTVPRGEISGQTVWSQGGTAVARDGTVTLESQSQLVRDGKTVNRDGTVAVPGRQPSKTEGASTREGESVVHEGNASGPDGKRVESEAVWTNEDGSTISRDGSVNGPGGRQTSQAAPTRAGKGTAEHPGSTAAPSGASSPHRDTVSRERSTVILPGSVTPQGAHPRYADGLDLFGASATVKPAPAASGARPGGQQPRR